MFRPKQLRVSVLDGTTDPSAPGWKQVSADDILHTIALKHSDQVDVLQAELTVRHIRAMEVSAAESAAATRWLPRLTWVLVALTVVLVALTIVLAAT
jgi:hypothetical protein